MGKLSQEEIIKLKDNLKEKGYSLHHRGEQSLT
jgi:hypothetical protein